MIKGELWIVEFPFRLGREQSGKRPSLVIADTKTSLCLMIPLTSNLDALNKLPHTISIKKSGSNGLDNDSVLLLFQLQTIDKKRFHSKIGNLEKVYLDEVNNKLKELFKL